MKLENSDITDKVYKQLEKYVANAIKNGKRLKVGGSVVTAGCYCALECIPGIKPMDKNPHMIEVAAVKLKISTNEANEIVKGFDNKHYGSNVQSKWWRVGEKLRVQFAVSAP